jgi:hypothetical protein
MREIEEIRKSLMNKLFVGGFLIVLIIFLIFKFSNGNFWIFAGGGTVGGLLFIYLSYEVSEYKNRFTYNVLKPFLLRHGLEYFPSAGFEESEALTSGFFDFDYDDFYSSDLIKGDGLKMSHLEFIRIETYKDGEGKTREREVVEFSGFLIIIQNEFKVQADVFIKPNAFHLSDVLPIVYDKNRVKMDNPEFEDTFDVYSNDQIRARYLLNHEFMERLLKLHREVGFERMRFVGDELYLTLKGESIQSSVPIFTKIDEKAIQRVLMPVECALYIKETLNKGRV